MKQYSDVRLGMLSYTFSMSYLHHHCYFIVRHNIFQSGIVRVRSRTIPRLTIQHKLGALGFDVALVFCTYTSVEFTLDSESLGDDGGAVALDSCNLRGIANAQVKL